MFWCACSHEPLEWSYLATPTYSIPHTGHNAKRAVAHAGSYSLPSLLPCAGNVLCASVQFTIVNVIYKLHTDRSWTNPYD